MTRLRRLNRPQRAPHDDERPAAPLDPHALANLTGSRADEPALVIVDDDARPIAPAHQLACGHLSTAGRDQSAPHLATEPTGAVHGQPSIPPRSCGTGSAPSAEEARALWGAIADRFAACKLELHPQKTKIVYCKDVNRRGDFPDIHFDFLGFQFRARKIMWVKPDRRIFAHSFQPAASPKALTRISREIRRRELHHRSDKSLTELAQLYNPCIRGWITYYSHFYKTQLRPTLKRIDAYVIRRHG
jgi:hypothetical protein